MVLRQDRAIGHPEEFHPFNLWVNEMGLLGELCSRTYNFSCTDIDMMFWADRPPYVRIFFLEVKSRGVSEIRPSQRSALSIQHGVYRAQNGEIISANIFGRSVSRRLDYRGTHLLTLSGEDPDDSDELLWNREPLTHGELLKTLRFEDPPTNMLPPACIHELSVEQCAACNPRRRA